MKIFAVSDSFGHFEAPIREFIIRLRGDVELELIAPTKHKDPDFIIRTESERILATFKKGKTRVIYLDIAAKTLSTEALSEYIQELQVSAIPIVFLIGGAYGVDTTILSPYFLRSISLSPMTLPHSLALLVLLEQVYRSIAIARGSKYHHTIANA